LVEINYSPTLFNPDLLLALVDRVESQYNFLCHTVGMSWRKSKAIVKSSMKKIAPIPKQEKREKPWLA
jgi:hypothetical protein